MTVGWGGIAGWSSCTFRRTISTWAKCFHPRGEGGPLDLSIEQAVRLLVSGGSQRRGSCESADGA